MDKNLYSDLEKNSNEDTHYNSNNQKKKLYVLNFTPLRLVALVVSFFVVFITLFTIGFSLGNIGKGNDKYSNAQNSVLMRQDENTMNSTSIPAANGEIASSINNKKDETIVDMKTLRNAGSIVADDDNSVTSNYDDYTVTLNRELEGMNNEIKHKFDIKDALEVVTAPNVDNMYIQVPVPDPLPPVKMSSSSKVTKMPYTDAVDGNLYYIQVAVGYNKNFVEKESERIKQISSKTFIKEESKDGETMYKIKVGRFTSKTEAEKVLGEIKRMSAYKDSYIYTDTK